MGALLGAWANEPDKNRERPTASQERYKAETVVGNYAAYPVEEATACYESPHHDSADLCAQWRAAIAAEKSAESAHFANWLSVIGAALTLAGMGFIYSTLVETRRGNLVNMRESARATRRALAGARETAEALSAANEAARAATRQAEVTENSSVAQLRCYLVVDKIEPFQTSATAASVKVHIRNAGVTPARVKSVASRLWIAQAPNIDPIKSGPEPETFFHLRDWFPQGASDCILTGCDDASLIAKMNSTDQFDPFVYGRIEYEDVFGRSHWMTFAYKPAIWGLTKSTEFTPCICGNDGD